jgi:FdhD protein
MTTHRPFAARRIGPSGAGLAAREVPEEVPVAISHNGATTAVMMATPADLEDFARGFTVTEGIAAAADITGIDLVPTAQGIDLQVWLRPDAAARLAERRRRMVGPVGCGLCGIESLEEASRSFPPVTSPLRLTVADILAAAAALTGHQPLHDATRAAHAAGFWVPGRGMVAAREDVGRHNALDKLAGALILRGIDPASGAAVVTSRLSVDLVQKVAALGMPAILSVSAPTAAALDLADRSGITVAALIRADRFDLFTHPDRILPEASSHVA